jgi:hypothetical protein
MLILQALVAKLQQDAYKFPSRIAEFKVQSQGADRSSSTSHTVQAPPLAPVPGSAASAQQVLGIPHGVDDGLLSPLHHQPLGEALEDVLQSAHQPSEPWLFPSFGAGGGGVGFDAARDPFDVQFSAPQTCGLLLSSTGARL